MDYEPVIGLEVHAQLLTSSKMFCRCSTQYAGAEPNTHICPVCAGFPGVLPVLNEHAVELAMRVGLALNCTIAPTSRFDRKNYIYPDLPKGYQISQYALPLATEGYLTLRFEGGERRIGIIRVHMEEDTGKLLHRRSSDDDVYSLVDLNRSGVPLLEIVSAPDIHSPTEARDYVTRLRQILRYIDASSGNMEEGALRVDANVSVRPAGQKEFGAKVEIKNMNSFRAVERAIGYEIQRQTNVLASGGTIQQETRGWDEAAGVTLSQRTKEYAHDYRYFPEPDLTPIVVDEAMIEATRLRMAELPDARARRLAGEYGITAYDAELLTTNRETADYFERVAQLGQGQLPGKLIANWMTGELFRLLRRDNLVESETAVTPALFVELLMLVAEGTISPASGRAILEETFATGQSPSSIARERGLLQISNADELTSIVREVLARNAQAADDFRNGKPQAVGFLIGQVMKETKGRAKADVVRKLLVDELQAVG